MKHRYLVARDQRRRRQRLTRIERTPHDGYFLTLRELRHRVDSLCGVALRVAYDEFDLAAVDAAGGIDLRDRELGTAVHGNASRRTRTRQRRQETDFDPIG